MAQHEQVVEYSIEGEDIHHLAMNSQFLPDLKIDYTDVPPKQRVGTATRLLCAAGLYCFGSTLAGCLIGRKVKINSTCTVFAGAELRERLSLGEKREDILAGLHRAIILRAMSLLARSGGIHDEFTFTGGVARNTEAVKALRKLVVENYGERQINISADSIYTGALGAALFAMRTTREQAAIA